MGGCGKTTVAAAYAKWLRRAYHGGVFLFHAQSSASFHHSLRNKVCSPVIHAYVSESDVFTLTVNSTDCKGASP